MIDLLQAEKGNSYKSGSMAIVQFESDVLGKLSFIEEDLGTRTTAYGLLTDFINAVTG